MKIFFATLVLVLLGMFLFVLFTGAVLEIIVPVCFSVVIAQLAFIISLLRKRRP